MIIESEHEPKTSFCTYIYVSKWHFFSVEKPFAKWTHTLVHIYMHKNAFCWLKIYWKNHVVLKTRITIKMHFGTYIYVPKCGIILQRVPQDSNFSHGFLKTVTSPKHYKNQWFLLIISSFLHPCLPFCLTSPKHYKNQWFLLIISSFLHPYLPPFVLFIPSPLPPCLSSFLSLSLPA